MSPLLSESILGTEDILACHRVCHHSQHKRRTRKSSTSERTAADQERAELRGEVVRTAGVRGGAGEPCLTSATSRQLVLEEVGPDAYPYIAITA